MATEQPPPELKNGFCLSCRAHCDFIVGAVASYLLTDSLIRAIPFSIDGKSKLALINGFYAAAPIPIAQTFWS